MRLKNNACKALIFDDLCNQKISKNDCVYACNIKHLQSVIAVIAKMLGNGFLCDCVLVAVTEREKKSCARKKEKKKSTFFQKKRKKVLTLKKKSSCFFSENQRGLASLEKQKNKKMEIKKK